MYPAVVLLYFTYYHHHSFIFMKAKIFAEAFGTFALSLAVLASVHSDALLLVTPLIAALTLGLFVYTIGNTSGCHINPAVTIGLWSIGKISVREATTYVLAQLAGGLLAFVTASFFISNLALGLTAESGTVFFAELLGMLFFTFGIASVVFGKVPASASGIVIGGSLLLGLTFAVHFGSAGILNPAVGLAVGSVSLSYLAASLLGSALGMRLYKLFCV